MEIFSALEQEPIIDELLTTVTNMNKNRRSINKLIGGCKECKLKKYAVVYKISININTAKKTYKYKFVQRS